jgi:hypothetical protein
MADKFVLLLEFSSGLIEPLPLSKDVLTHDRIVIAIDELKERVWLWLGGNSTLVERRAAQRKARSLVSAGYQLGPLRIGRDVAQIEIIDGEILDDSDTQEFYNQLIHTLSQKFKITDQVLGRFSGTPSPQPPPSQITPPPPTPSSPAPSASPPQPAPSSEPSTSSTTTDVIAPRPARELQDLGIIRVGILISTILDHFPLCYISKSPVEDGFRYIVEDPDGTICELEVKQGSVHFLQRYDFRGKRKEILSMLRDRLAAADL